MSELTSVLDEFMNANSHRAYPFNTLNSIDTTLFLDLRVIVDKPSDVGDLHISEVNNNPSTVVVTFSCDEDILVGTVTLDKELLSVGSQQSFVLRNADKYILVEGTLYIGDINCLESSHTLTSTTGAIYPGCIWSANSWCRGLVINGQLLTGVVSLEAGEGMEFTLTSSSDDETIVSLTSKGVLNANVFPSYTDYTEEVNTYIENNWSSIVKDMEETYGKPITSINGVSPDAEGNITISSSTLDITGLTEGLELNYTISDSNLTTLIAEIAELNTRAGVLETSLSDVDDNVDNLSTALL